MPRLQDYEQQEDENEMKLPEEQLMETPLELHKWINDPAARQKYGDIIKDIPLSNLDPNELWLSRNFADFVEQLHNLKLMKAAKYFKFQLYFLVNASLGKGGFARRMIATNIFQQYLEKRGERKAGSWWKLGR